MKENGSRLLDDFNLELEKLRERKKHCLFDVRSIGERKQGELAQATKQINDKYSKLLENKYKELCELNYRTNDLYKVIEFYSYFDVKEIGDAISSLMSVFEGLRFIYQDTYYLTKQAQRFVFDCDETSVEKHVRIIVAEEYSDESYSDNRTSLNLLIKNEKAFVLDEDTDIIKKEVPFYYLNMNSHSLEQTINFGKFSYVKDFIDILISYKIENKLKNISFDEVVKLETEFIESRLEEIKENNSIMGQQQEKQMQQTYEPEREKRQLMLKRNKI